MIDDFIARVASEPERTVERPIWNLPAAALAKAREPGGMKLETLLASPGRTASVRTFRYRHMLGAPATFEALEAWRLRYPEWRLPDDLVALVRRINGIHLWANVETGRAYQGIAPIEEWEAARLRLYGPTAGHDLLDDRYIAVSYHQDDAAFVILDAGSGTYFLMDAAGPDLTSPIARNVAELLDWLWRSRLEPQQTDRTTNYS
jgi:hypothetical protein